MNLLDVHLTLLIGSSIPTPAPAALAEALKSVQVTHTDQGPSGFQLTFHIGRSSVADIADYQLLLNPLLKPFNRVVLLVRFAVVPEVLMDGIITYQQLNPGTTPGSSTLTITGEDVSVMMDLEQHPQSFPVMPDNLIVTKILLPYIGRFQIIPKVLPPPNLIVRNLIEGTQHQDSNSTDRAYIQELAQRHGYVFYIEPGPLPAANIAYWGPPNRVSLPQGALSVNMGPETNVDSINFTYNALAPNRVKVVSDSSETTIETYSPPPLRVPLVRDRAKLERTVYLTGISPEAQAQAQAQAQGMVDRSLDEVVTATGTLDAIRYNALLKPRRLVGLRGVGQSYSGFYYVKSVTHSIRRGEYKQNFTLSREGTGTTTRVVKP